MAEFLVSGYYGDNNAGDEAILAGIIRAVREADPGVRFTVISKKAAYTRAIHGVAAVSRNDFKSTGRAVARADLLLSGGGSLIQDVTSTKSLLYYLSIIGLAKMRARPVMVYAQGVGPVNRWIGRALVPFVMNRVDLVTVRDQESAQCLRILGVRRPPTWVTADAALVLGPSDPERASAILRTMKIDYARPIIGISVRPWRQAKERWAKALAQALDRLVREVGATILFIPMQQPHDVYAAAAVAERMQELAINLRGDFTHEEVQALIARCQLVIGMRYHALVFAAMNGVPLVGLSYDPKNDSFLRLIGQTAAGTANTLDPIVLLEASRRALIDGPAFRTHLLHKMAELTPLARENARLALQLLHQRRSAYE